MLNIERKQLALGNTLLTYYARPSQSKAAPAIIFLHGWRADASVWFPVFEKLSGMDATLYALDLPGFGATPAPSEPWHLEQYVDVVCNFISKLGLSHPALVGHSFGGRVAIRLAATLPGFTGKLVLVNSAGVRKKVPYALIKRAVAKIARPVFRLPGMQGLRARIYRRMGAEDYVATPELKHTFLNIVNEDLAPLFPYIKSKTLIIWGSADTETPLSSAHTMHEHILGSRLVVWENATHYSFLDQPDAFVQEITSFVARP